MDELSAFAARVRGHGFGRQRRVFGVEASPNELERLASEGFDVAPGSVADLARIGEHELDGVWFSRRVDVDAAALAETFRSLHHGHVRAPLDPADACDRPKLELLLERADFQILQDRPTGLIAWTKLVTPRVGTAAIILDGEGRVLLCERADGRGWCLPGGYSDPHESPMETAVRETREETGLEVEIDRLFGLYAATQRSGGKIVVPVFLCRLVGGELGTTDETTAFGWFAEDALPSPIFPLHVVRLADLFAYRRGEAEPPVLRDTSE
jgi:ADP-ribose pyrophosphatase YjhB (NUDIX family)